MTAQETISLLASKLKVCKLGYDRAVEQRDLMAAAKWRKAYNHTQDRIDELEINT